MFRVRRSHSAVLILVMTCVVALGGCSSSSRSPSGPRNTGNCSGENLEPNYFASAGLGNTASWASFPISAAADFDELRARGFSEDRIVEIESLIVAGLSSWARATGNTIGILTGSDSFASAELRIFFDDLAPGIAGFVEHEASGNRLTGASLVMNVEWIETRVQNDFWWEHTAAHEMGHVLGIVAHPTLPNSLMNADELHTEPTQVDVNSIRLKYNCP